MLLITGILLIIGSLILGSIGWSASFVCMCGSSRSSLFAVSEILLFLSILLLIAGILGVQSWNKPKRANTCFLLGILILIGNGLCLIVSLFAGVREGLAGFFVVLLNSPVPICYLLAARKLRSNRRVFYFDKRTLAAISVFMIVFALPFLWIGYQDLIVELASTRRRGDFITMTFLGMEIPLRFVYVLSLLPSALQVIAGGLGLIGRGRSAARAKICLIMGILVLVFGTLSFIVTHFARTILPLPIFVFLLTLLFPALYIAACVVKSLSTAGMIEYTTSENHRG